MEPIVALFVHLVVAVLIFLLLYWGAYTIWTAIPVRPPPAPPFQAIVRVALVLLLVLVALSFLCGEMGWWGTWGWGYHPGAYRR